MEQSTKDLLFFKIPMSFVVILCLVMVVVLVVFVSGNFFVKSGDNSQKSSSFIPESEIFQVEYDGMGIRFHFREEKHPLILNNFPSSKIIEVLLQPGNYIQAKIEIRNPREEVYLKMHSIEECTKELLKILEKNADEIVCGGASSKRVFVF